MSSKGITRRRAIADAAAGLAVLGLGAVATGVAWVVPDYMMSASYGDVAQASSLSEDKRGNGAPTADEAVAAGADPSVGQTARAAGDIDFASLRARNRAVVGWIRVPAKSIDFPVLQGSDNEYYLHHDMNGRWGYAGVFVDHRANPNGRNVAIYGHTLIGGGMFTKLGRADEPGQLATIGDVVWTTPEAGATTYHPIATLHVYPQFADYQQFDWEASDADVKRAREAIARERAQAGDWNVEVAKGTAVPGGYRTGSGSISVGTATDAGTPDNGSPVAVERYYVATDADDGLARTRVVEAAWRDYLVNLVDQSTQHTSDASSRIASGHRSLILACCSWPFDSHRTIVVCVA